MRKVSAFALVLLAFWTADARAVELKNVRTTYGPFGAPRTSNKMMPGDVYMINFDIVGLPIDAKTGLAKYDIGLEVLDPKGKQVLKEKPVKKAVIVALGGNAVPEFVHVMLGLDQVPGKYKAIVTIDDPDNKTSTRLEQEVELVPRDFGIIHIQAPAVGFTGQDYALQYSFVDMQRDANRIPKITVILKVLDENGKPTLAEPSVSKYPEDLPAELKQSVAKQELAPLASPMLLNRSGRFTVEIEARDELGKKTAKFSYKLTVVDAAGK